MNSFNGRRIPRRSMEDWQQPGPHTGKGPSSSANRDLRIEEMLNDRLTHHGQIDARDIQVEVQAGAVTLSGHVISRRQKFLAEQLAEDVPGVRDVDNELQIIKGWIETPRPHDPASVGQDNEPFKYE